MITPSQQQIAFQAWSLGIFLHFGLRTFYEGAKDWDETKMDASRFNPTELDCQAWIRTIHESGFNYAVLTAKHHDGFANWPSDFTEFSVASSPWKNGKGNVVKEFTDACAEFGIKAGLYYSPADASCPVYSDSTAYDDYFINQISELLDGSYGEISMLWFDGCGSENHTYDWGRITGEIRRMQPDILIFNMGDPDYRWVGNECGLADMPTWNVVEDLNISIRTTKTNPLDRDKAWLPAECDFMLRDKNWFYSDNDEHTVKSVDELMGIYYYSVGRGSNLLMNIGPDRRGLLPDTDANTLLAFGQEIKRRFESPLLSLSDFIREDNKWSWHSGAYKHEHDEVTGTIMIDHVVLGEDIQYGELAREFKITIVPYLHGNPITVYRGQSIGHNVICQFPLVRCKGLSVEATASDGNLRLKTLDTFGKKTRA